MYDVRNNCPRLTLNEMPKQLKIYISISDTIYNMTHNVLSKTIFDYLRDSTIYERKV